MSKEVVVRVQEAFGQLGVVKLLPNKSVSGLAHLRPESGMSEQKGESFSQGVNVALRNEEAGLSVQNALRYAVMTCGQNRQTRSLCFLQYQRLPFLVTIPGRYAGQDKEVSVGASGSHLVMRDRPG